MNRKPVVLGILAVAAAAVFVRLGVWQLDRLAQRRARNALAAAAWAAPELALGGGALPPADSLVGRRVAARGTYDFSRGIVWPARLYQGTPGVYLLTPLRLPAGPAVLVNRGWMPALDGRHYDTAAAREPAEADVHGLAVRQPAGPGAPAVSPGLLPFVVQALPDSSGHTLPVRLPPPALDEGPHLGYAIQWFAFAAIALVGTAILIKTRGVEQNRRA